MDQIKFYYLSRENSDRDIRMVKRFNILNLTVKRIECVDNKMLAEKNYENYGCQFGHLKMIKTFLDESTDPYGCFMEDDVHIKKTILTDIPFLISKIEQLNLDILLIGYLINFYPATIKVSNNSFKLLEQPLIFANYPNDLWGSQCYILTRNHAKYLINKYNESYLDRILNGEKLTPFAADWTITKDGNKALVFPMYMIEEGNVNTNHQGQINFHTNCHKINYDKNKFV